MPGRPPPVTFGEQVESKGSANMAESRQLQNIPDGRARRYRRVARHAGGSAVAISALLVAGGALAALCQVGTAGADTKTGAGAAGQICQELNPQTGYSPTVIDTAYGITPLLKRGVNGVGEKVVIPELFTPGALSLTGNASDIRQDLARFDSLFGLPHATIRIDTTVTGSSARTTRTTKRWRTRRCCTRSLRGPRSRS